MSNFRWLVEFDNVQHVVLLDMRISQPCRIMFDEEQVALGPYGVLFKSGWFEFERGGHGFRLMNLGGFYGMGLLIDGIRVKQRKFSFSSPKSVDSSIATPSNTDSSLAQPATGYELVSEEDIREDVEVIATEEFPLDNRAGAETLTIQQEISRTASNEITVGNTTYKDSGISLELFNLIKSDLSSKLTKRTGQTLGETVTRRQSITFSAGPHQAVTYIVTWKRRVQTGNYLVFNDGAYATVPYTAYFDLTPEVRSRADTPLLENPPQ